MKEEEGVKEKEGQVVIKEAVEEVEMVEEVEKEMVEEEGEVEEEEKEMVEEEEGRGRWSWMEECLNLS